MSKRYPKLPFLLIALGVVIMDQWSKWLVETRLAGEPPLEIISGLLNFTYVRNTGVAFGLFPSNGNTMGTILLTVLGLAALGIVGLYFHRTPTRDRLLLTSLGLILGGAVGNLADRVLQGAVTDFIDFYFGTYHWHTFNVADSAITIGIVLMILDLFRSRPEATEDGTDLPTDTGRHSAAAS